MCSRSDGYFLGLLRGEAVKKVVIEMFCDALECLQNWRMSTVADLFGFGVGRVIM